MARRADEWSCDNATHGVIAGEHVPGKLADMVELIERDDILVSGDLEDAIRRGVEDGATGAHVLIAQFFDDFGAGRWLVAQHFAPDELLKLRYNVGREAMRVGRKRFAQHDAGHFPVAGGTVLARARRGHAAKRAG